MKLNEITQKDLEHDQQIIDALKRDCKPYLSDANSDIHLFRGMKSKQMFSKKAVRRDREPKDTPEEIHEILDDWFLEKFGHRYRSNALFTSTTINEPKYHGDIHEIFPIGNYKCVYSFNINDLYAEIERLFMEEFGIANFSEIIKETPPQKLEHVIHDFLDEKGGYKEGSVNQVGHNYGGEVMVKCDSYYAINISKSSANLQYLIGKLKDQL